MVESFVFDGDDYSVLFSDLVAVVPGNIRHFVLGKLCVLRGSLTRQHDPRCACHNDSHRTPPDDNEADAEEWHFAIGGQVLRMSQLNRRISSAAGDLVYRLRLTAACDGSARCIASGEWPARIWPMSSSMAERILA